MKRAGRDTVGDPLQPKQARISQIKAGSQTRGNHMADKEPTEREIAAAKAARARLFGGEGSPRVRQLTVVTSAPVIFDVIAMPATRGPPSRGICVRRDHRSGARAAGSIRLPPPWRTPSMKIMGAKVSSCSAPSPYLKSFELTLLKRSLQSSRPAVHNGSQEYDCALHSEPRSSVYTTWAYSQSRLHTDQAPRASLAEACVT